MNNWMKVVIAALLISCFGLMGATGIVNGHNHQWKPESVNLALRQVAHRLYSLCGNHTERIDPVQQKDESTFSIRLNEYIDYEQLPRLVDQAVKDFGLPNEYGVAVKNCDEERIELGYTYIALEREEFVPCQTRDHNLNCSLVELIIYDQDPSKPIWRYLLITLLLGSVIGLFIYNYVSSKPETEKNKDYAEDSIIEDDSKRSIGNFLFDHDNQLLILDGESISLTFRESKLLDYLSTNRNQVLSRDQIQANVWEDEGVIVGRSLDVFISRLRKILKSDPSIQIKSVHGVGYRLEVK